MRLYRFFPDKQTVVDAIAVRHVEQFKTELESTVLRKLEQELSDLAIFQPCGIA